MSHAGCPLPRLRSPSNPRSAEIVRDDHEILYYVLIGGSSLPYVNAPEVRLLTGRNPNDPKWIQAHADGLVAILLPGLAAETS